tara:strand:+ start:178 stop:291 length:114 start_codon:yes stop_codon:yes gene_type:complete
VSLAAAEEQWANLVVEEELADFVKYLLYQFQDPLVLL